jgi:hypothetical protein
MATDMNDSLKRETNASTDFQDSDLFEVKVVVNHSTLQALLKNLQRQSGRHEKMLATLVDDVRSAKAGLEALKTTVSETMTQMKKQLESHDRQLRVTQQLADVTVSTAQFNTAMFKLKEEMTELTTKQSAMEEAQSRTSQAKMEAFVSDYIAKWYVDVCQKDFEAKEEINRRTIQEAISNSVIHDINKKLEIKAQQEKVQNFVDALRTELVKTRKASQEEIEKTQKTLHDLERSQEKKTKDQENDLEGKFVTLGRRIDTLYDMFSLSEKQCAVVSDVRPASAADTASFTPSSFARSGSLRDGLPPKPPTPKRASEAPKAQSVKGDNSASEPELSVEFDDKTSLVMQSPVFLGFKHQLLKDLSQRLQTTRAAQSSDLDIELLDIRNELRQRVTVPRVIELIKQHLDTDTPAKVALLHRRMQDVEIDKVSHSYLNEALRGKGDLHLLETKADRLDLKELDESLKFQLYQLNQEFQKFERDRSEFQLLKKMLDMGIRKPVGAGESDGGPDPLSSEAKRIVDREERAQLIERKAAESLPTVRMPSAGGNAPEKLDEVLHPPPEVTYLPSVQGLDRRSPSAVQVIADPPVRREASNSRQGKKPQTVRPLTDHRERERAVSHLASAGGPAEYHAIPTRSTFPAPTPPPPSQSKEKVPLASPASPNRISTEAVVPLTASQKAYAQFVAENAFRSSVEESAVPPYRDLKSKTFPKVYE